MGMVRQEKEPRGRNWERSHGIKEQFRRRSVYVLLISWQQDAGEHVYQCKRLKGNGNVLKAFRQH